MPGGGRSANRNGSSEELYNFSALRKSGRVNVIFNVISRCRPTWFHASGLCSKPRFSKVLQTSRPSDSRMVLGSSMGELTTVSSSRKVLAVASSRGVGGLISRTVCCGRLFSLSSKKGKPNSMASSNFWGEARYTLNFNRASGSLTYCADGSIEDTEVEGWWRSVSG